MSIETGVQVKQMAAENAEAIQSVRDALDKLEGQILLRVLEQQQSRLKVRAVRKNRSA